MQSKVVINGFAARHYDELLDIFTLWWYPRFIKNALLRDTKIGIGEKVAELGVGNGRNARILSKKVGSAGKIIGFDISQDMLKRAREKCRGYDNIEIHEHDIRTPYPDDYRDYFDSALIVFVFHGFPDEEKKRILENLKMVMKPGGKFYVLDYQQVEFEKQNFLYRTFMQRLECPLAIEFLKYDIDTEFEKFGFKINHRELYFRGLIQLAEFVLEK
ncbi:MAG: class I SAM-dependent methyltransferase [Euryarchaeota archaeon]|nr:class I SAM-dependent methyltransferase [Euryarchaeota archaeon]